VQWKNKQSFVILMTEKHSLGFSISIGIVMNNPGLKEIAPLREPKAPGKGASKRQLNAGYRKIQVIVDGAGLGEFIVSRWVEEGEQKAGLVDFYATGNGQHVINFIEYELGIEDFELTVSTHPHLDHIRNMDLLPKKYRGKVKCVWYSGGPSPGSAIAFLRPRQNYFQTMIAALN
jgi:hypothetical protein